MKVLQINTVCGTGSTGRIVIDLYRALEAQKDECLIAYGRGAAPQDINAYRIGSDFDMRLHAMGARITDKVGFYSKRATRALIDEIKKFSPDIIHLHNLHGYYVNIKILFKFLEQYDKPVIWTLHDCWAFTGHCTHFSFVECNKWKSECKSCPQKKQYPTSWIFNNSKENYHKKRELFTSVKNMEIITVSDWLKRMAEESFLNRYTIRRIYNGVDLNVFQPTTSKIKDKIGISGKHMVLCVSDGWDKRKGFLDILDIASKADHDTVFVIIGLTKQQIEQLPTNVIGLERTWNVNELVEYYSAADVFLNPSCEETFGLVTAEALACGTPAIVYNTTACPELVDEFCGLVVKRGDIDGLSKAVNTLKSHSLSSDLCIHRVNEMFRKEAKYHEYITQYKKILHTN